MRRNIVVTALLLLGIVSFLKASEIININSNWQFNKDNDKQIETVTLPHTWNALDGQDGGNNYYRGIGWYKKSMQIPAEYSGKTVYLKIGAANMQTNVYVNGNAIGRHIGGYAAFAFDITKQLKYGKQNEFTIEVNNSDSIISPPLSADFTFFGGITRNVELIVANPVHFDIDEQINNSFTTKEISVAQSGIVLKQHNVSEKSADLDIIFKIKNSNPNKANVVSEITIKDAAGNTVKTSTETINLEGKANVSVPFKTIKIDNPHLWDGLNDPYLYKVVASLKIKGKVVDQSVQPLGFRYFSVDPDKGFILNGKSYPLRGICLHEEKKDKGRAVSDADRKEALDILRETGCNFLRLAHYQHGDFTYNYLDSLGIICWTEIPAVNSVSDEIKNVTFRKNAVSQMYELMRQQYNHPSVIFWGLCNEINYQPGMNPEATVKLMNDVVKSEDTYRLSTLAAMYAEKPNNWIPDVYANNRYDGWYYETIPHFGKAMDELHQKYPSAKIGVSEYGVGANIHQHEYPVVKPAEGGQYHPEEYQNLFHEEYLKMINDRPFIWGSSVWAGFDFASDRRNEGSQPGINDKGLVTFDRSVKKDAFYWLKANWNKNDHFVYITSRRFTNRTKAETAIKVYSNCSAVVINVNGTPYQATTADDHIFLLENITLKEGENIIEAIGMTDGKAKRDRVTINYMPEN